jgi:hypothetical protein
MNNAPISTLQNSKPPAACPMHVATGGDERLDFAQALNLPMHQRVITQFIADAAGNPVLYLFCGDQEVSFDEPELFAFGETLARQSRFLAGSCIHWGQGYEWPRMQELLEALLAAGILERAPAAVALDTQRARYEGARDNPLPPATTTEARTWHDCEAITRELGGRAVELAHLELVIPIFRIAHMALDAEGRQVGEANVFPKALRLDVSTNWRACIYPGSRYQDERPMNVTALKSMRQHWPQMMAAIGRIREAYLQRFPQARSGWTVGDVERLSTLVLALPTYALMKNGGAVANGELHPVLSNLFRVTDGVRMTTHQMLFVPVAEATLSPLSATSSAAIYAYAERNYAFASTHGVCAGPKAMIEEFLSVLLDGNDAPWADQVQDAAVEAALADMQAAFDYGLRGLQAHAVVFSLWPMMTRTYEQLFTLTRDWNGERPVAANLLLQHLQGMMDILKNQTLHASEEWRVNREQVYADIDAHCRAGLGLGADAPLAERIASGMGNDAVCIEAQLQVLIAAHLNMPDGAQDTQVHALAATLSHFFRQARAVLRIAEGVQESINQLLGRPAAQRAFTLADMDVHVVLQGSESRRLPHLLDALQSLLGFTAGITQGGIRIRAAEANQDNKGAPNGVPSPEFAGIGLADQRAICTTP